MGRRLGAVLRRRYAAAPRTCASSRSPAGRSTPGIGAAQAGNRIGDIGHAIGAVAREAGLGINMQFGGHGVGRTMHGDPHIANDGTPGRGFPLKPGLVIAIEPWFLHTTDEIFTDPDGWTLRSADGSRGAHMEHTIAITEDGPIVLTSRD